MLVNANALSIPLADGSVQMCVTSPPYWGLRDYGVDDQLGQEPTPEQYVENMVAVFREVKRVLRDDGILWLNLGDSYYNYRPGGTSQTKQSLANHEGAVVDSSGKRNNKIDFIKEKDLVGIPWRVALALQADGWYLRNDIIWHKTNPMPESVTDRCTKGHEYIFLLAKSEQYYYDHEAVKEPLKENSKRRAMRGISASNKFAEGHGLPPGVHANTMSQAREHRGYENMEEIIARGETHLSPTGRNKRTVWTISTKPYSGAHYAVFPPEIPEICIKAGTSEKGQCPICGSPWKRVIETDSSSKEYLDDDVRNFPEGKTSNPQSSKSLHRQAGGVYSTGVVKGWKPTCEHYPRTDEWRPIPRQKEDESDRAYQKRKNPIIALRRELLDMWKGADAVSQIVLDPFVGSGTTCMVARKLGRRSVGIDLSYNYLVNNARKRLELDKIDQWQNGMGKADNSKLDDLPMFGGDGPEKDG